MICNLDDLMKTAESLSSRLKNAGVRFDVRGFPLLPRESYLDEWPDRFIDYSHRNGSVVQDKSKTAICFFSPDCQLFPRLEKVYEELPKYQGYMAVAGLDLTVTQDMDFEYQSYLMLVNALFMGALAVNDVKVVPNLRSGNRATVELLSYVPTGVLWVSSSLGCRSLKSPSDTMFLEKTLYVRPSKLALYGKSDGLAEEQLSRVGIDWRRYPDTHAQYRARDAAAS